MEHEPVQSSSIRSIGYDEATQSMEIQFVNGGRYLYRGVTPETHQAFMSAESIGKHCHSEIKSRHTGTKL